MTIVITKILEDKIIMVADSFVSLRSDIKTCNKRVLKLIEISNNGGIAVWGANGPFSILLNGQKRKMTFIRIIEDFSKKYNFTSKKVSIFVNELASHLNELDIINENFIMGAHICGFEEDEKGKNKPVFYHVHNKKNDKYFDHKSEKHFIIGEDCTVETQKYDDEITINGDYMIGKNLFDYLPTILDNVKLSIDDFNLIATGCGSSEDKIDLDFNDSAIGIVNKLIFLIRLVSAINQTYNKEQIVGGEVPFMILKENSRSFKKYGLTTDY